MLLRNQLYAGVVDVPEYSVHGKRGDFEADLGTAVLSRSGDPVRACAEHGTAQARASRPSVARFCPVRIVRVRARFDG